MSAANEPWLLPPQPRWRPPEMTQAPMLDPAILTGPIQSRYALLINPFYPKDPNASFGKHVLTPTLALTSFAATTPEHWQVRYWDENLLDGRPPFAPMPELLGITVHLTFARRAFALAQWYRSRGSKVVLGGLHVLSCPAALRTAARTSGHHGPSHVCQACVRTRPVVPQPRKQGRSRWSARAILSRRPPHRCPNFWASRSISRLPGVRSHSPSGTAAAEARSFSVVCTCYLVPPPSAPLPELLGITVHLTFARRAFALAQWYRSRGSKVVLGGLHVLSCPAALRTAARTSGHHGPSHVCQACVRTRPVVPQPRKQGRTRWSARAIL